VRARNAGIGGLSDHHWKVLTSFREEVARTGHAPGLRRLETLTGLDAGELRKLFSGDPEVLIARLAGLTRPRPGSHDATGSGLLED
jgi:hypothetical protein